MVNQLIDIAKQRGGGRVYAGLPSNWGGATKVGQVDLLVHAAAAGRRLTRVHAAHRLAEPGHRAVLQRPRTRRSTTSSTSSTCWTRPGASRPCRRPRSRSRQGYTLWRGASVSGYLEVVDTTEPVAANRTNMAAVYRLTGGYLASPAVVRAAPPARCVRRAHVRDAVD